MRHPHWFSPSRFWSIVVKEFIQIRRDRLTFGMMIGIPILQLIIFGYAINANPKHLPTAVVMADNGPMARTLLAAIRNSDYFDLVHLASGEEQARRLLMRGDVQFVINIPPNFTRDLLRGERPALLVEADASDPSATGNALGTMRQLVDSALREDIKGPLAHLAPTPAPIDLRIHARYNPEAITRYNIVPGLMGAILTMTMVMITAVAMTRERERGTMENLLAMPTRPLEMLVGKIIPYILVGYMQIGLIVAAARLVFDVPIEGSLPLLGSASLLFICANLAIGVTFSTIARNQLQAMQMSFFFFLPSLMLSGFMFPFRGMPRWAQAIGEILPLTHYLRIVRGIALKGSTLPDILPEIWPLVLFFAGALAIGVGRYRRTLD